MIVRAIVCIALALACAGEGGSGPVGEAAVATLYPQDYRSTYVELRACQRSGDHDLSYVLVLGTAESRRAYLERSTPFAAGAVLIKEQYDFADDACAGPVQELTVMRRDPLLEAGLGWRWQRTDAAMRVLGEDEPRCIGCHSDCGQPPMGFQGTCATP